ncbi:hypothetical protein ACHAWU_005584 [Discostella pseudostelligera]|uniref:Uncharacterized protein n=1 Tax=Discostella pseudostelligera TaxID=259834 RepID=A0ABD3N8T4_9STRA
MQKMQMQRYSRPSTSRRKLHPHRRNPKRAAPHPSLGMTHFMMILYLSSMAIIFFQNNHYAFVVLGDEQVESIGGVALPATVLPDRISTTDGKIDEQQLHDEIKSDNSNGPSWEDDDDDVYETIVVGAGNEVPSNKAGVIQVQADERTGSIAVVLSDDVGGKDVAKVASEDASQFSQSEVVDEVIPDEEARPNDDDDTIESLPALNNDATLDVISGMSDNSPDVSSTMDAKKDVDSVPVGGEQDLTNDQPDEHDDDDVEVESMPEETADGGTKSSNEFGIASSTKGKGLDEDTKVVSLDDEDNDVDINDSGADENDDDDDDDDVAVGSVSENAVDVGSESGNEFGDASLTEGNGLEENSEDMSLDDENNSVAIIDSGNRFDDNSEEMDDTEDVPSATNIDADRLYGVDSLSTAYHRSQSIEGDSIIDIEQSPIVNEATAEILQANGTEAENAANAGNENYLPTEGNDNNNTEEIPNGVDPTQQPPIQGWDDTDEGSFLELMQSTFNVLLLAALLTSLLVLRKRVMRRLNTDSTLSVTNAILDEMGEIVLKIKSWVANASSSAGDSGTNFEGQSYSSVRTNGSFRAETTPLSTAVDEEWGWGDEDVGQRLELSTLGGDEEKEDEDLALALAMSLSESQNDRDDFDTSLTPPAPPTNKRSDKKSPPTKPSNSNSSRFNSSTTREETQRKSFTPQPPSTISSGGSDSIEDLLGQIGGSGGPMITSFGQKIQKTSNPKQTQQSGRSEDDIFDSMGLSNYPSTTAANKPARPTSAASGWQAPTGTKSKSAPPKSAPVQSLLAATTDADTDSWGDDGDLDDLLDD